MRYVLPLIAIGALFLVWRLGWSRGHAPLVVYCAHDSIYSEKILRDFEQRTGIPVATRFDTEATKSLGLTALRCLLEQRTARHAGPRGEGNSAAVLRRRFRAHPGKI
jgi:hypothetical protein